MLSLRVWVIGVGMSQILHFDATQIFNISNNKLIQSIGAKAENIHFSSDEYKGKYIKMLEEENDRMKKMLKIK